jgi:hypothetical protein
VKRPKPPENKDESRTWHVGKCPRCEAVVMTCEQGPGDSYSRSEMERMGYNVSVHKGQVSGLFRPHSKECV